VELPLVCTLTAEELKERRRTVLESIRELTLDSTPILDGYAYRFAPRPEVLSKLSNLVELERHCCSFLTFKIVVEAGVKPIRLEVTGPPATKGVIINLFG
jgi:hypothetical protein